MTIRKRGSFMELNFNELSMPVLPLRGINVFPNMILHFDVKRDKSVKALEAAMEDYKQIFLVAQKEAQVEEPNPEEDLYEYGTISKIKQIIKLPGNISRVLVEGQQRGKLDKIIEKDNYVIGKVLVEVVDDIRLIDEEKEALLITGREIIREHGKLLSNISKETIHNIIKIEDIGKLADSIATNFISSLENKQSILSKADIIDRYKLAITILNSENEILKIKNNIQNEVKKKIDKSQKDYYLREQLKVIQSELGDKYGLEEEIAQYKDKVDKLKALKDVKNRLHKEITRLNKIPAGSSEGAVVRNYIECLLDMPWNKKTKESQNIEKAEKILDEDHYGLEKVKERVIEHLAVRKLSNKTNSPIICLVGPPGTGKTSIARSIARAVNRKYARISLGGVKDESEIRGHRKTYVGAMPGRIINALKSAESGNPLILLDEIDKTSGDFRGDPSAALLEVLDGEQNYKFRDHYVEVPVDLSDVLFVATANSIRNIPRPLLDRLELIQVSSYTENEKVHIARQYLIPKQIEKHGLNTEQLKISEKSVYKIISEYTKEAGVRNLERKIGEIGRKVAKEVLMNNKKTVRISEKNIKKYLGNKVYSYEQANKEPGIGVARGLAWTEVGGDTLEIEVNVMEGKGKFEITGHIGNVMKESAKAAISYIRSNIDKFSIEKDFYIKKDIHIHIPEGAVPKDGPSAGITMATAIISALTTKPISNKVAMTGEITLRGRVLPIGGLKEKLLAAKRAGIKKVLVPYDNKKSVEEISKEITKGIEIVYVKHMNEVIEEAIIK
jgi:ATP-dependent Lon protease